MALSQHDSDHLFQSLRQGTVPERGLDEIAVGIEPQRAEIHRLLDLAESGEGVFKLLRGGYGCGKTFMARLAVLDAQHWKKKPRSDQVAREHITREQIAREQGFATSFVVVSDNDLHFHRFDQLYGKVVSELSTANCSRGALGDIIDRWIGGIEEQLVALHEDDGAPDFDDKVRAKLEERLASMTGGKAPDDMVRVVRAVFDAKQAGDLSTAGALLSWLSGSTNVAAAVKRRAEIKGDIASKDALSYLRGILEIVKAAGYEGLVIVIDEAETILRMRTDVRGKSLNGIRQIIDATRDFPGLLWIFTGTPDFFDGRRGVAGLQPLHDRVRFNQKVPSLRQPQLELRPFDASGLRDVALRLRASFNPKNPERVAARVSTDFIDKLVAEVTRGFAGDVGVVPRQFLRELVDVLDHVDANPDFDPMQAYGFDPKDLTYEELRAREGKPGTVDPEPDDDKGYDVAPVVEF